MAGEPLQYVLGRWGFRRLDLALDRRVLIPRPETEEVVDHALAELDRRLPRTPPGPSPSNWRDSPPETRGDRAKNAWGSTAVVVDLGTGSGAIALSVAAEREGVTVWGTERSPAALALARANLAGLGGRAATRVRLAEGDWYDALPADLAGSVDVIVANPPYVAAGEELPPVVADWEPPDALVSGPTGLEAVGAVVAGAPRWLAPGGALVVEVGATQATAARALAVAAGFAAPEVRPDLAGRPRVLVART